MWNISAFSARRRRKLSQLWECEGHHNKREGVPQVRTVYHEHCRDPQPSPAQLPVPEVATPTRVGIGMQHTAPTSKHCTNCDSFSHLQARNHASNVSCGHGAYKYASNCNILPLRNSMPANLHLTSCVDLRSFIRVGLDDCRRRLLQILWKYLPQKMHSGREPFLSWKFSIFIPTTLQRAVECSW